MPKTYRAPAFADALPELSGRGATPERLAYLAERGYLIIDDFVGSKWIPRMRAAGRRVSAAVAPENGYDVVDSSKAYIHRTGWHEPWAIRGLAHPALKVPQFSEFHGSDEFLDFVAGWCDGLGPEDVTYSGLLLWCNPKKKEHALGWHRDASWWGGPSYRAQEVRNDGPEAYSEKAERGKWPELQQQTDRIKQDEPRNGVSMFLALTDDECHEVIPGSHYRWRTPFEHDVLLPQGMKDMGVPHTPSWDRKSTLPGQTAVRLRAGQALIRIGTNIHTGHTVPERERNTLAIGWSKWSGKKTPKSKATVCDARSAWQLDPAVREAMPHEFMKVAWDRWAATQKLGDTLEDRYAPWDIARIKEGNVIGWRSDLEKAAAAAGERWEKFQTL